MNNRSHGARVPILRSGHNSGVLPPRGEALEALGPVIYAVRNRGYIKIGFTTNLRQRIHSLGHCELIGVIPSATIEDEVALHASLAGRSASGREWYPLDDPEVLAVVDQMRTNLGLPPLAA